MIIFILPYLVTSPQQFQLQLPVSLQIVLPIWIAVLKPLSSFTVVAPRLTLVSFCVLPHCSFLILHPEDREDQELRSLFAAHFTRQEERETKFATEVTSNLVKMNAQLNALNGSFVRQEGLLDALNGSFSRQEGLLAAILRALQTLVIIPFRSLQQQILIDLISRNPSS
jgi:hypothetical protein